MDIQDQSKSFKIKYLDLLFLMSSGSKRHPNKHWSTLNYLVV